MSLLDISPMVFVFAPLGIGALVVLILIILLLAGRL